MKNPYIIKCNFRDAQKDKYSKIPNVKLYSEEKNKSSLDKKLNKLERGIYYSLTKGKGYHVIKNYFSKKKINKAFQIVDIVVVDLIQPKIAMNVFKKLLGTNFLCGFFGANCLLPGARGQLPHLDYPYYRFVYPGERVPLNGKNNFFLNCQILIPLTKFDKENGSTGFLKNTHKLSLFPKENYHFKKKFTQLKLDVGTLVIFNGLIWHLAKPNYSEKKKRYGILGEYIPEFIAPLLDLKKITKRKIISDDKKFLRQLLGVDLKFPSLRK
jgi:ectoine hydroxylase-related dioxygenase (phytanoyl-CoA dioxygenase family)